MKKALHFILFFLLSSSAILLFSSERQNPLWGDLKKGKYSVGFKTEKVMDTTRTFGYRNLPGENTGITDTARPIWVSVWYPVSAGEIKKPLEFKDYVYRLIDPWEGADQVTGIKKMNNFSFLPVLRGADKKKFEELYNTATAAIADALPLNNKFPMIIFAQGLYYESPVYNVVLYEYLASHGYVVVTSPLIGTNNPTIKLDQSDLETQVRDLEFLASYSGSLPYTDITRIGLIGFDLGGLSGSLMAMRNTNLDVMISLDSGLIFEHNIALIKGSHSYKPERFRLPLLQLTRFESENKEIGVREDWSFFDSTGNSEKRLVRIKGMVHGAFTSGSMFHGIVPRIIIPENKAYRENYEYICNYVLNFLDVYLKKDPDAFAFLESEQGIDGSISIRKYNKTEANCMNLPVEDEFINMIFTSGMDYTLRFYNDKKASCPDHKWFSEEGLNRTGYQFLYFRGEVSTALEIFLLNASAYPESANVYESLGEAYLFKGKEDEAIKSFRKSLELNPGNEQVRKRLIELTGEKK